MCPSCEKLKKRRIDAALWGWKTKDFIGTLTYVKITSSGVNCALKNSRRDKSRSEKDY